MSPLAERTIAAFTATFPSYEQARAAELAERRLDGVHAEASQHLLRH